MFLVRHFSLQRVGGAAGVQTFLFLSTNVRCFKGFSGKTYDAILSRIVRRCVLMSCWTFGWFFFSAHHHESLRGTCLPVRTVSRCSEKPASRCFLFLKRKNSQISCDAFYITIKQENTVTTGPADTQRWHRLSKVSYHFYIDRNKREIRRLKNALTWTNFYFRYYGLQQMFVVFLSSDGIFFLSF